MVDIAEEEYDEMAECPTCGADIPIEALICPSCGQEFEEDEEEVEDEELLEEEGEVATTETVEEENEELFAQEEVATTETVEEEDEELFAQEEVATTETVEETVEEEELFPEEEVITEESLLEESFVYEEEEEEALKEVTTYEEHAERAQYFDEDISIGEPVIEEPVAAAPVPAVVEAPQDSLDEILEDEEKPAKMFWIGVILVLLGFFGGPILSYLHDALRIPIGIFKAYEKFGWVNWLTVIVGTIILGIGVVLLIIGWIKIQKWRDRMEALIGEHEITAEAID